MLCSDKLILQETEIRDIKEKAFEYIRNCKTGKQLKFRYKLNVRKSMYINYNGKITKVYPDKFLIELDSKIIKMISVNDIIDSTFREVN
jgi:uncharacterized protein Veg